MTAEQKRLFIGGLAQGISQSEVKQRFSKFGTVNSVELKTRCNSEGLPVKTFAHVDINITEEDFKRCMKLYNKTKWKGGEMQIQQAKENFLDRLKKERDEGFKKDTDKVSSKATPVKEPVPVSVKGAVPGTPVEGHENWVVGKYGRVLPVMHIRRKDKKKVTTVDPSKFCHNVKKMDNDKGRQNDDPSSRASVEQLTWQLDDKDTEISKKRKGQFPSTYGQTKKTRKKSETRNAGVHLVDDSPVSGKTDGSSLQKILNQVDNESAIEDFVTVPLSDAQASNVRKQIHGQTEKRNRKSLDLRRTLDRFDSGSGDSDSVGSADTDDIIATGRNNLQFSLNSKTSGLSQTPVKFQVKDVQKSSDETKRKKTNFKVTSDTETNMPTDLVKGKKDDSKVLSGTGASVLMSASPKKLKRRHDKIKSSSDDQLQERTKEVKIGQEEQRYTLPMNSEDGMEIVPVEKPFLSEDRSFGKKRIASPQTAPESKGNKNIPRNMTFGAQPSASYCSDSESSDNTDEIISVGRKAATVFKSKYFPKFVDQSIVNSEFDVGGSQQVAPSGGKNIDTSDEEDIFDKIAKNKYPSVDIVTGSLANKNRTLSEKSKIFSPISRGNSVEKIRTLKVLEKSVNISSSTNESSESEREIIEDQGTVKPLGRTAAQASESDSDDSSVDEDKQEPPQLTSALGNHLAKPSKMKKTLNEESNVAYSVSEQGQDKQKSEERNGKEINKNLSMSSPEKVAATLASENKSASAKKKKGATTKTGHQVKEVKQAASNQKRLESLKQRQKEAKAQKSVVQQALAKVDFKEAANRIVFDSDSSSDGEDAQTKTTDVKSKVVEVYEEDTKKPAQKAPRLFDEDSEEEVDEEKEAARFNIRPEFEGEAGRKLMALQSRYKQDERFKLDTRFLDSDVDEEEETRVGSSAEATTEEAAEPGLKSERDKSMEILQSIVGKKTLLQSKTPKRFKDVSTLHYDPTREDHDQFEVKATASETEETGKRKRKQHKKSLEEEEAANAVPEVSKDRFFEVTTDLKEAFNQKEGSQFSLLSALGRIDILQEEKEEHVASATPIETTGQFPWQQDIDSDSSDEGERNDPVVEERQTDYGPAESDKKETNAFLGHPQTFFFQDNDPRIREGVRAFCRQEDLDSIREKWQEKRPYLLEVFRKKRKRTIRAKNSPRTPGRGHFKSS